MNKKKSLYLSIIVVLLLVLTSYLFYQKSIALKSEAVVDDLRKALLTYIEKEESYPKSLTKITFDDKGLSISYEALEDGRGCRFIIEGQVYELWDEKR